jgi:hypothetical protein
MYALVVVYLGILRTLLGGLLLLLYAVSLDFIDAVA